jgi:hypothetical protein
MELLTTVRDFSQEITVLNLAPETHIRVIIDESAMRTQSEISGDEWLPPMTRDEQVSLLNRLPHDYDAHASEELIQLITTSHKNTEAIEL